MKMRRIKVLSIIGARPQFIKVAVVSKAFRKFNKSERIFEEILVHTGQHYDFDMSAKFFRELQIPRPKYNLRIKEITHAQQTAKMMVGIEKVLIKERPDVIIVYGDTNTTLAGALAAAKLKIPVAHIEAGLRSFNRSMPEEINRVVTDRLSSFLFCPTETAVRNLKREGIIKNVFNVGDVMYDSIKLCLKILKGRNFENLTASLRRQNVESRFSQLDLKPKTYYLATIHRAENTDNLTFLKKIFSALNKLDLPVIIPIHPRTKKSIAKTHMSIGNNLYLIAPVSYLEMLNLEKNARVILTDSGGVQKEAFFLGIPCVVLRPQTEWIETVRGDNNVVVGSISCKNILKIVTSLQNTPPPSSLARKDKLFGKGNAGSRIVRILSHLQKY